ncbi:antibiotic biosynthesis monooxygenase [Novosphingobium barchaimii LL02]|uniref:Antibiotic biosynthesis monooxygenase n=2 Tax=Novosphingobium barchaimii TaxID=1420591 RepID=A0A0J7XY37_9SPHN|nr:antibiotic biosynthesis monooxygenase [Novosphingobium barchaimii LL02]
MIAVIMHVRTKPDKTQRFIELTTQLQKDVRANEPDTLLFQVLQSQDDANAFVFTEFFTTMQAKEEHALRPYHVAMSADGYACLDGDPDIRCFDHLGEAAITGVPA